MPEVKSLFVKIIEIAYKIFLKQRGLPGDKGDSPKLESVDGSPDEIVGPHGKPGTPGDKGNRGKDGRDGSPGEPGKHFFL